MPVWPHADKKAVTVEGFELIVFTDLFNKPFTCGFVTFAWEKLEFGVAIFKTYLYFKYFSLYVDIYAEINVLFYKPYLFE